MRERCRKRERTIAMSSESSQDNCMQHLCTPAGIGFDCRNRGEAL
jgi:hypothetical protein